MSSFKRQMLTQEIAIARSILDLQRKALIKPKREWRRVAPPFSFGFYKSGATRRL
jgi:hypothetical protein